MAAKKLPKVLPREDVAKILSIPNIKTTTGLRNRVILQVMYRAGLRVQEVCNLTVDDVDLEKGFIYVQAGKGEKDRYIPMDLETMNWCRRWAQARGEYEKKKNRSLGDYFFPSLKGTQLDQRYIREMCYRLSKQAGVYIRDGKKKKPVHPHVFRHCCMTELLEDGFTINEVKEIAGHSSILTTSIYLSVRPEQLAAKMRQRVQSVGNGA